MNNEKLIITDMGGDTEHKGSNDSILCLGIESSCDETSAAIVDDNKNVMKIMLNDLLAAETVFQEKWEANKAYSNCYTAATLFPGDEVLLDNWKLTRLIPEYDAEEITKPETEIKIDYIP